MKVYLAGPITGCTYDGCTDWRDTIKKTLENIGVAAYSPMRHKEHLLGSTSIEDAYGEGAAALMSSQRAIFVRDKWDVMNCDILLVNLLGAERVSIGTMFEMAWANNEEKLIITVIDNKNMHDHSFVREASGWIVPSLGQACEIINKLRP